MAFFIQSRNGDGDVFEMDATTEVDYILSGNPTSYAVESGVNASDHYQQSQPQVRFSGVVSDVKFTTPDGTITTLEDFERGLTDLQRRGELFACTFSQNLDVLVNCLFTNLNIRTTPETGPHSREISFNIVQIEQAQQAVNTTLPVAADNFKDTLQPKGTGAGSTSSPTQRQADLMDTAVQLIYNDPTKTSDFLEEGN